MCEITQFLLFYLFIYLYIINGWVPVGINNIGAHRGVRLQTKIIKVHHNVIHTISNSDFFFFN